MTQKNNPNQVLHDLLVTRNFNPESIDSKGKSGGDPADAVSFKFDYKGESGKDYGTAVAMINNKGLTLFFGDNLGKSMESADKNGWFSFLEQLKNFAIRDFGSLGEFNISDISKLKYSMQGQAAIKDRVSGTSEMTPEEYAAFTGQMSYPAGRSSSPQP